MTKDVKPAMVHHTTVVVMPMPDKATSSKKPEEGISLESKVKDMIDLIESGHNSSREWIALNKFYDSIKDRKDQRSQDLIKMIQPTMSKYGQFGVAIKSSKVGDRS